LVNPCSSPPSDDVLNEVVGYFETNKKLKFSKLAMDRHKGFFVRRRATTLGCANASWVSESSHTSLKKRIDNEYTQLEAFLKTKAAALDPTNGGTDLSPPHLDLHDLAKPKTTTSASTVASKEADARRRRTARVSGIGWRAAAIHPSMWQGAATSTTATLNQPALHDIIDRRLRMVERMNFQISRAEALGGSWAFSGGGPTGPWQDGFRVRMFEYPRIPRNPAGVVGQVVGFVGEANIAPDTDPSFQTGGKPWKWEIGHHRLYYNVPPWPGNHFPTLSRPDWKHDLNPGAHYYQNLTPSTTGAAAIDNLFTPNSDWWERAWLFCDQVLSALQIDALLFALRRRAQPPSDAAFNAIVTGNPPGYVALSSFVRKPLSTHRLMADTNDQFFDNMAIDESDIQIGDQLIFWNSFVYTDISSGEWRLENSVVIDVDSDQKRGSIHRQNLHLQGHGTSEKDYTSYQRDDIAGQLNLSLKQVRDAIKAALASAPNTMSLKWNGVAGRLVRWDPYEPFNAPGAWWVQMSLTDAWGHTRWAAIADALQAVQGSVSGDPTPGADYTPPPSANAVYFPLFRPAISGGWTAYFNKRRTNAAFRAPKNLAEFNADGSIMPGLFYAGQGKPISIIRAKVMP
jgi:hypothetical protein